MYQVYLFILTTVQRPEKRQVRPYQPSNKMREKANTLNTNERPMSDPRFGIYADGRPMHGLPVGDQRETLGCPMRNP